MDILHLGINLLFQWECLVQLFQFLLLVLYLRDGLSPDGDLVGLSLLTQVACLRTTRFIFWLSFAVFVFCECYQRYISLYLIVWCFFSPIQFVECIKKYFDILGGPATFIQVSRICLLENLMLSLLICFRLLILFKHLCLYF